MGPVVNSVCSTLFQAMDSIRCPLTFGRRRGIARFPARPLPTYMQSRDSREIIRCWATGSWNIRWMRSPSRGLISISAEENGTDSTAIRLHYTLLKQALSVTHARISLPHAWNQEPSSIQKECGKWACFQKWPTTVCTRKYGNAIAIFKTKPSYE